MTGNRAVADVKKCAIKMDIIFIVVDVVVVVVTTTTTTIIIIIIIIIIKSCMMTHLLDARVPIGAPHLLL